MSGPRAALTALMAALVLAAGDRARADDGGEAASAAPAGGAIHGLP